MTHKEKFLVVTPCHNRIFDSTLKDIFSQVLPGNIQFDLFCPFVGYDESNSYVNILEKYNQALEVARKNNYDGIYCVESDMKLLPYSFIELYKVAKTKSYEVVYGLYVFRRPPYGLNDYIALNNDDDAMYGYPLSSVHPDIYRTKLAENAVVPTDGVGLGNTLIMRKAFEATPFVMDWSRPHGKGTDLEHYSHCDWYTALEWQRLGIRSAIHYGVRTGHHTVINGQAATLWPAKHGLVPFDTFRVIPYGGFDTSKDTIEKFNWVNDTFLIKRFQECLVTPTDMAYNLQWLSQVARGNVVELGTRYGISTTAFMVSNRVDKLVSIDIETDFACQFFDHDERFTFYKSDSTDKTTRDLVLHCNFDQIDLLFVDTLHTTEQVLAELDIWFDMVKPDGLIVFHDAQIPEVRHAVDLWFDRYHPYLVNEYWYPCGTVDDNPYPVIAMRKV